MSGPMTEPREALATSICSTFDMGHHHHEAFLQPDHCDDGLSDADELLRSLRAQGYSVARSEGPGLDAPSLDEGLLAIEIDRHWLFRTEDGVFHCSADDWEYGPDSTIAEGDRLAPFSAHIARAIIRALAQEGETPK